jgi:hypothetical protein
MALRKCLCIGLSSLKGQLDARGVRLIGIAGEHNGREEFQKGFWRGELYFDLGKKTWFPAMHGGKQASFLMSNLCSAFTGGAVYKAYKRIAAKGFNWNTEGSQAAVLGGVWVLHPSQGVIYEYREKTWGDNAVSNDYERLMGAINELPGAAPGHFSNMPPPNMQVSVAALSRR